MITAGVDIGSTTSKAVLLNADTILAQVVIPSGTVPQDTARLVFDQCCESAGISKSHVEAVATTGYGRRLAQFGDMVITEIKACGLGAVFTGSPDGSIGTIIDVGGQDTKVITLNENGSIDDFAMNDKCAAGTGRFLEMLAVKLEMDYNAFVESALSSNTMIHMNSTCAVFAESEVISLLARNVDKCDIAAAAHYAIAERIGSMVRRVGCKDVVCFAGGGARNRALVSAIEEVLDRSVYIPEFPQTMVALGAALAARDRLVKGDQS
ncbi:MAG: hypothetical protein C4541_06160 [Candidatus Auribacter fodinae]|jgi:predicted CoA-substrate-specific enzyme activase|uniref:ATPase BadF/BadG/BcrA/BcrD type domain-containing protein n=1 Tax=Candidatus Auribacter fodinae TaxID=2093366 RepID=A0A3A4RCT9_9BACT|nr:MAG: hypothetical protein C4541_06160 [Candidatus Auribacter fodinae]